MRFNTNVVGIILAVSLLFGAARLAYSHEPGPSDTVTLKPGDTLVINFDGAESAAIEISVKKLPVPLVDQAAARPTAIVAPATEQAWVTETQKFCGPNGCYFVPVRRLVTRTVAIAAPTAAVPIFTQPVYSSPVYFSQAGCGCGCPGCTCNGQAASVRVVYPRRLLGWRWR